MIEPIYGAGSTLWTGVPTAGFAFPMGVGGSPAMPTAYAGPMPTVASGVSGPTLATGFPFALNSPAALFGPNPVAGLTAPSLLTAVAMRRGQPQGPTNDQEVEDFIYDALELLPGAADVEVRCEGGRVTLTGSAQHKRVKRDGGEIAWAIPGLHDVQNNVTIASRRRTRSAAREAEGTAGVSSRKQS